MVDASVIKRWADGVSKDAEEEDTGEEVEGGEGDNAEEEVDEQAAVWAGDDGRAADELRTMPDDEAEAFMAWLDEHEPGIAAVMIAAAQNSSEDATAAVLEEPQVEDSFPEFDAAQRTLAIGDARTMVSEEDMDPSLAAARAIAAARATLDPEDADAPDAPDAADENVTPPG
jgi:hypothetical protein